MYNFKTDFEKCQKIIIIDISDEQKNKIKDFYEKLKIEKMKEKDYQKDHGQLKKRTFTGKMGECALENLFNIKYVDWNIGHSSIYNVADLKPLGVNAGVKTVEYGKYPIIKKQEEMAEIICVKLNDSQIAICGLAPLDVLNKYSSDDLILDPNLRKKGYKTGFYGFKHLIPFNNLEELKKLVSTKENK